MKVVKVTSSLSGNWKRLWSVKGKQVASLSKLTTERPEIEQR